MLEDSEIAQMEKQFFELVGMAEQRQAEDELLRSVGRDRLVELAQAEKDGRLVMLPCKIGEMWDFEGGKTMEILGFHIDQWAGLSVLYSLADAGPDDDDSLSSCNSAYFLAHFTRHEAEAAEREEDPT